MLGAAVLLFLSISVLLHVNQHLYWLSLSSQGKQRYPFLETEFLPGKEVYYYTQPRRHVISGSPKVGREPPQRGMLWRSRGSGEGKLRLVSPGSHQNQLKENSSWVLYGCGLECKGASAQKRLGIVDVKGKELAIVLFRATPL